MAVTLLSQELWKTLESREQNVNMEEKLVIAL
jgi:hypothetical protein